VVFVTEAECVHCAVRTGSLSIILINCRFKWVKSSLILSTFLHSFMKDLYCSSIHNPCIYIALITAFVTLKYDMKCIQNLVSFTATIWFAGSTTLFWPFQICFRCNEGRSLGVLNLSCLTKSWYKIINIMNKDMSVQIVIHSLKSLGCLR